MSYFNSFTGVQERKREKGQQTWEWLVFFFPFLVCSIYIFDREKIFTKMQELRQLNEGK